MPRDGSGTFSLPAGNPVVNGDVIDDVVHNNTMGDIRDALTASVAKDGQTTMSGALPMGTNKITGLGSATARTDAVALGQIQDGTGVYAATVGGTADAITISPSPSITAYSAGQRFSFIAGSANTGAATVAVSGLTAKSITKYGSTALAAGDIASGALVHIEYDGTRFQLTGPKGTASQTFTGTTTFTSAPLAAPSGTAPLFFVRAWALFEGNGPTGAHVIVAGGNIASIVSSATGRYTVTFTTAMPSANYAVFLGLERSTANPLVYDTDNKLTTAFEVDVRDDTSFYGPSLAQLMVIV